MAEKQDILYISHSIGKSEKRNEPVKNYVDCGKGEWVGRDGGGSFWRFEGVEYVDGCGGVQ